MTNNNFQSFCKIFNLKWFWDFDIFLRTKYHNSNALVNKNRSVKVLDQQIFFWNPLLAFANFFAFCRWKSKTTSSSKPTHHNTQLTHHVYDLHQRQAEAQLQGIGFVDHRSLQCVVGVQQIVQQPLFVVTGQTHCKEGTWKHVKKSLH